MLTQINPSDIAGYGWKTHTKKVKKIKNQIYYSDIKYTVIRTNQAPSLVKRFPSSARAWELQSTAVCVNGEKGEEFLAKNFN